MSAHPKPLSKKVVSKQVVLGNTGVVNRVRPTRKTKGTTASTEPAVIGDARVVAHFLKTKKVAHFPKDSVARHISQLIKLHPSLKSIYGNLDLVKMDKAEKNRVLAEINHSLGIDS